jgi:hypothetical protein
MDDYVDEISCTCNSVQLGVLDGWLCRWKYYVFGVPSN